MDQLKKAIDNLGLKRLLKLEEKEIRLAILLKKEDWRHLAAPWWRSKSASIAGVDLDGNFILCKSSGSFILWEHKTAKKITISKNLDELLEKLEIDPDSHP